MSSSLVVAVDVADSAIITAFLCSIIFILGYTWLAPWWHYPVGRALISLDAALLTTLLPSVIRLVFRVNGHTVFFTWYTAASIFLVAAATLWRLKTINHVQHTSRRSARSVPTDPTPQEDE